MLMLLMLQSLSASHVAVAGGGSQLRRRRSLRAAIESMNELIASKHPRITVQPLQQRYSDDTRSISQVGSAPPEN